jgi:hypothetical protein
LVQADFLPGPSFATLVQRSGTTKLLLTVAQDQQLANKVRAAVGDIGQGTNILIGNPSATQIVVTPRFGATSNLPGPSVTIAPRGVGKIPITTPNTHVTVFSEPEGNGPPIVAILAIDTGKVDETYLV